MNGTEVQILIGHLREWERIIHVCGPGSHPTHGAETLKDAADALEGFQRSIIAHHNFKNLSTEALDEWARSKANHCLICEEAQRGQSAKR